MRVTLLTLLLIGMFAAGGRGTAVAAAPETILHNGKILTVDRAFTIAEAVSIAGDRIIAVGTSAKLLGTKGPATRVVDLGGRTVIPGLIDNHLHYLRGAAQWRFEARIDGITSRKQALEVIATKAREAEPGAWVFVLGGWSEDQFADAPGGFSAEELDAAAPRNPVFVQKSYNQTYTNTAAAQMLGSSSDADRRSGGGRGSRGRGPGGGGRSTGGRSGDARAVIARATSHLPERNSDQRVQDVRDFNVHLNRLGLTTVYDVGRSSDGDFSPVRALADRKKLTVRVFHSLRYAANDPGQVAAAIDVIRESRPLVNDDWHGVIGIGEHTYSPLHDSLMRADSFSDLDWEQFERLATAAAAGGWPLHEHAMQDTTAVRILDICERLSADRPLGDLRWTLAHCDLISIESVDRARRLGLVLALHNKTAKPAGRQDSPPVAFIERSGIPWGLGSDGTIVAPINPFTTLWWVTSGKVFPDTVALRDRVSREAALVAHTRSNAFLLFKERDLGTLEAGKLADMVVLDRDYLTIPVDDIKDIRPVLTMVGGRIVHTDAAVAGAR